MDYKIGDVVIINKQEYKIIKMYPKKLREHDVFLCENIKNKYTECFTRYNLKNAHEYLRKKKDVPKVLWTQKEKELLRECLKKGMPVNEIAELIPNRTIRAIERISYKMKMEEKNNGKEGV